MSRCERRLTTLTTMAVGDTVRAMRDRSAPPKRSPGADAIDAGVRWLCLTHDVTGRRGCSKGYSLLRGWFPPFPETTGYIIGTLARLRAPHRGCIVRSRALEMGDWEIEVQCSDGGVMEGLLLDEPKPSTVFNTGMVMHGWLDLYEWSEQTEHLNAAVRAGDFLRRHQDRDGAWRGDVEYSGIPHTYCSRVSWALVRLADSTGESSYRDVARRQLDWVLPMQHENGWFASCEFKPGRDPNTTASPTPCVDSWRVPVLLGDERYLSAVRRTSDALISLFEARRVASGHTRLSVGTDRALGMPDRHSPARRSLAAAARAHGGIPIPRRGHGGGRTCCCPPEALAMAGGGRRATGFVSGVRPLRPGSVPELGDEVSR